MVNNLSTVGKRVCFCVLLGGVLLLAAGSAGAGGSSSTAGASANAFAIRVVAPGQTGATAGAGSDPPPPASLRHPFLVATAALHPRAGGGRGVGSCGVRPKSDAGTRATASASGEAQTVSLF